MSFVHVERLSSEERIEVMTALQGHLDAMTVNEKAKADNAQYIKITEDLLTRMKQPQWAKVRA